MTNKSISVELTQLQASHTIVALKEYSSKLLSDAEKEPVGGEHEDYLIIQSVIKEIASKMG
jgi:hypothetical protein